MRFQVLKSAFRRRWFPTKPWLRVFASLALTTVLWGCAGEIPEEEPGSLNVILVSIDTLRPDHLGCYGYDKPTSPSIDAFCEDSLVFERAYAQAPSTLLSHTALFTSLIPQHHGASHIRRIPLSEDVPTLTTLLSDAGYATASFNGGSQLAADFGLDQGFDVYESLPFEVRGLEGAPFQWSVDQGLGWIDQQRGGEGSAPFFLFLHSYEVHHPYTPEARWLELFDTGYDGELPDSISIQLLEQVYNRQRILDDADLDHIRATYDAEIRSMDEAFGALMRGLEERGLLEETILVFTSDHGEEFGEHGHVGWHSHTLYNELLRVPLMMRFPGSTVPGSGEHLPSRGVRVGTRVRSIDIVPTLLEALGLGQWALDQGFRPQGQSLQLLAASAMQENGVGDLDAMAFWDTPDPAVVHESLASRHWKYHDGELYDLSKDPGEQNDLSAERPDVVEGLRRQLDHLVASREAVVGETLQLDEATERQLEALGYTP